MEKSIYSERVFDHFSNPRNVGKIDKPDGVGMAGDPSCGDFIRLYIKIEGDYLSDIKYEIHGCPAAIATTSAFSELAKGRLLEEAQLLSEKDIVEALGGLPEDKIHCSCMAVNAFQRAILDWIMADGDRI
ncbi:MAG: iron-sulfur cluster assembly scaffold protein [Eubacteriales bacterium]